MLFLIIVILKITLFFICHLSIVDVVLQLCCVVFFLQGAPGNRGFPGQDGLPGPKVSISSHRHTVL